MDYNILGVDPGSIVLGYGLLLKIEEKESLVHIKHGTIEASAGLSFNKRLYKIGNDLEKFINDHHINMIVIEKIFLGLNPSSAFKLGHIRGLCLYLAQKKNMQVFEYSPKEIKKGLTGSGAASKQEVQAWVCALLGLSGVLSLDASDALAMACHHARILDVQNYLKQRGLA